MTVQFSLQGCVHIWRWRQAVLAGCLLFVAWRGTPAITSTQVSRGAEANQLHVAITNGDVESLRYWLQVRHADASSADATEPDVTPLERCLGLVTRVLDIPPAGERGSREIAAQAVSLRVVQEMVTLLHEHGAQLTDADRQHFSDAVLKWYDDAASLSSAPPLNAATKPTGAPASSGKPDLRFRLAGVAIITDSRVSCNGTGHPVYVVNETELSVTATVMTTYEGGAETSSRGGKSDAYTVDRDSLWRLGCDTSADGRRVRYELTRWR